MHDGRRPDECRRVVGGGSNLSSLRARQDRAKYLQERARAADVDWMGLIEEFTQAVLQAEREGEPSVLLCDVPAQSVADESYEVLGIVFPPQPSLDPVR